MEIKTNVGLHNKFVIEVRDAETGELKQTATSYNIILDQMYTRLCAGSSYFVNIHFGTGTGTLSPSRTSLFTHLGTKTAVDERRVNTLSEKSITRKIVINPEEFVGSTFREVGIAFGSTNTNLITHSLLRDSEGVPLEITKTATDVLTIYATVYVVLIEGTSNFKFINVPHLNPLTRYLLLETTTLTNLTIAVSEDPFETSAIGVSSSIAGIADVSNKRRTYGVFRFGTTTANGHIKYMSSPYLFVLELPAVGVYGGSTYSGVALGIGDGGTSTFSLPSRNIDKPSIVARLNGVVTAATVNESGYHYGGAQNLKMSSQEVHPSLNIGGDSKAAHFNATHTRGIIGYGQANPRLVLLTKGAHAWDPAPFPIAVTGSVYALSMSGDGKTIAVIYLSSPTLDIFTEVGGAWTQTSLTLPVVPGGGNLFNFYGLSSLSLDFYGSTLAVGISNFAAIFQLSLGVWGLAASSGTLTSNTKCGAYINSEGTRAIFYSAQALAFSQYRLIEGAWVYSTLTVTGTTPGTARILSFSVNRTLTHIAVSSHSGTSTERYTLYEVEDTSLIEFAYTPGTLSAGNRFYTAVSDDGVLVFVQGVGLLDGTLPLSGQTALQVSPQIDYSADAVLYSLRFSNNKDSVLFLTASTSTTALIRVREAIRKQGRLSITFDTPPAAGVAVTADYTVDGIHKTDQYVVDASFAIQFGEIV